MAAPLKASSPRRPQRRNAASPAMPSLSGQGLKPQKPKKSGSGLWLVVLLALALGGGGYYYVQEQQRMAKEKLEAVARAEREAEARRRKAEEERRRAEEARRQREAEAAAEAERKRLEAEEAERKRLEAEEAERKRREAEEAERRRREQEGKDEPEPPAPEPTPEPVKTIYDGELQLIGGAGNARENRELFDAMVAQVMEKGEYELFAAAFAKKIRACAPELVTGEKMSYSTYRSSKVLGTAMDFCLVIDMAGAPAMAALTAEGAEAPAVREFLNWALTDKSRPLHTFLRAFELNEGRASNMAGAMKTWFALWKATPEKDREKYLNLAIACALLRPEAAQASGGVRNPKTPLLTVPQVYDYFREMDAKKKLLVDVKKTSVSNLLYVVDVRLPRSEFDWVHENLKYSQAQWGQAYPSIRYLMERATNGKDPYTHYTFEELRKEGGVCRDQGYFAANTAKCKGIPAVYIVGDGDRGSHAWIATMVDALSWQQTGSYGYNTGRFTNPCSGRGQHESVLLSQNKMTTDERLTNAAEGMIVSDYLSRIGCTTEARAAAKYVTAAFPRVTSAWANRLKVLKADPENLPEEETWKQVGRELARQGRHNPELLDFAAEVENDYLMEGKSVASQKSSMKRSLRQLQRSVGDGRSDLVLEAVERQAKLLVEAKDMRGLAALYKKQLKESTKRGDVFQRLLSSYMSHWEELEATERQWGALAKEVESIFEKGVLTGTNDHFKLTKEVLIQNMVAHAYEKAGNERKAKKLKESAEQRLKNSKERYSEE